MYGGIQVYMYIQTGAPISTESVRTVRNISYVLNNAFKV